MRRGNLRPGDWAERDGRAVIRANPAWAVGLSVVTIGGAMLLGLGALAAAVVGGILAFDAAPFAVALGIAAAVLVAVFGMVTYVATAEFRMRAILDPDLDIPEVPLDDVPERDAIREAQSRALSRRIEAQSAARNQSPASGGSVSSTDAGRPPKGSSDAVTDP